ncbi:uncharacterized protein LOC132610426 [Lycium barbarum]|uniref:uncharacterized protein LOC132610426 n=1 Tax=Lycium barbarum TaxID=112863 RepID=UPI00293E4E42|nr:uncharacterized protein LOC132610426 [Lycium barbarum]
MANQGEQEMRTLGETAEMLRDKVLQIEKHLQEIGRKIEEVDRLLEMRRDSKGNGGKQRSWIRSLVTDPQGESEPQQEASELVEEEEPKEEEEDPQNIEREESEPVDVGAEREEEPFGMFPEFAEFENESNEESDYYAPTNEGSKAALAPLPDKGKEKMNGTPKNRTELALRDRDTQDPQEVSSQKDVIATLLTAVTALQEKIARNEATNAGKDASTEERRPPPPFPSLSSTIPDHFPIYLPGTIPPPLSSTNLNYVGTYYRTPLPSKCTQVPGTTHSFPSY